MVRNPILSAESFKPLPFRISNPAPLSCRHLKSPHGVIQDPGKDVQSAKGFCDLADGAGDKDVAPPALGSWNGRGLRVR